MPPRRLLWLGGIGIAPLAAGWNVSDSLLYLALLQLFAGAVWAMHELAVLLLFFDAIDRSERVRRVHRAGPKRAIPALRPLAARPSLSLGGFERPVLASLDAPEGDPDADGAPPGAAGGEDPDGAPRPARRGANP